MLREQEGAMHETPDPYRRVFFPTGLGGGTEQAYVHAFRLALAEAGDLHVVHVHLPDTRPDWSHLPSARDLLVRWGKLGPDATVVHYEKLGVRVSFTALPSLELESPITAALDREIPDLLVMATAARKGADRLRVPSVAEDLARHAGLPALFVPADARPFVDAGTGGVSLRKIVVPVGSPDEAHLALREARRLVSSYRAEPCEFVLVHVGQRSSMPALVLPEDDPRWEFRVDVRQGGLAEQIVSAARAHEADAIVMTTHGHDSIADWLRGSHAEVVVRNAHCPVLAVPLTG